MLFVANWLVLFVFLYFSVQVWRQGKKKLTTACAILWLAGRLGFPQLGINGSLIFIPYASVICLILIYTNMINKHLPGHAQVTAEQLLDDEHSD